MATVDELIEQSKLKETAATAEPSGGLLSRIGNFIGGSDKTDTLDASGLTQADRRQSLFAGLTDIGAKLMAAGEPMYGAQRAGILASMGNVPANMAQMRSTIAQQKLLGIKGVQAQREMQVQREMDAVAKDPNHPMWKQFQGQDLALAQWAMRTGGPKAFMEFLAHKDDAAYKRNMGIKALADAAKANAEAAGLAAADAVTQRMLGGGAAPAPAPAAPAPAPAAPAPAPAAPAPAPAPSPGTDASDPAAIAGMRADVGPALTPQQQMLAASQPPTAQPSDGSVAPTQSAQAILQGMQAAGPGGGAQVVEGPTSTPQVPTPGQPGQPGQPAKPVTLPPGYGVPRTIEEITQHLTPVQRQSILGMWPPQKRLEELQKYLNPDTKPVFHIPSNQILFVNKNAPPHPDFAPKEEMDRRFKLQELAQKAINDAVEIDPTTGEKRVNETLARANYEAAKKKAEAEAEAQQIDRLRATQETTAKTGQTQADIASRTQAVTAATQGLTPTAQVDPAMRAEQQRQKQEEEETKSRIALGQQLSTKAFETYNDKASGPAVAAAGSVKLLPQIYEAKTLYKDGMMTGSLPETRQWLKRAWETMGLGTLSDEMVNRSGYDNIMGRIMLESLAAGRPLGSQVSDADREAMKSIVGSGALGKAEVAKLMDIAERAAKQPYLAMQREIARLEKNHPELKGRFAGDLEAYKPPTYDEWLTTYRENQRQRKEAEDTGAGGFGRPR